MFVIHTVISFYYQLIIHFKKLLAVWNKHLITWKEIFIFSIIEFVNVLCFCRPLNYRSFLSIYILINAWCAWQASLCDEEQENFHHVAGEEEGGNFLIKITCGKKGWMVKRTHKNFCMLDRQLHKCMFDRKFSRLPELQKSEEGKSPKVCNVP